MLLHMSSNIAGSLVQQRHSYVLGNGASATAADVTLLECINDE